MEKLLLVGLGAALGYWWAKHACGCHNASAPTVTPPGPGASSSSFAGPGGTLTGQAPIAATTGMGIGGTGGTSGTGTITPVSVMGGCSTCPGAAA